MAQKGLFSKEEFTLIKNDLKKRIKAPTIEPYEKFVRKCWQCNKALYFYEFCDSNTEMDQRRLSELWESPFLQFLCCDCYKKYNQTCDISPI